MKTWSSALRFCSFVLFLNNLLSCGDVFVILFEFLLEFDQLCLIMQLLGPHVTMLLKYSIGFLYILEIQGTGITWLGSGSLWKCIVLLGVVCYRHRWHYIAGTLAWRQRVPFGFGEDVTGRNKTLISDGMGMRTGCLHPRSDQSQFGFILWCPVSRSSATLTGRKGPNIRQIHARIPKRSPLKTFKTHQLVIFQGRIRDMHEWHEFIKEIEDVAFWLSFMRSS